MNVLKSYAECDNQDKVLGGMVDAVQTATFATCDTSTIVQPASKRGKHPCEDSVWKAGARLSAAWMSDPDVYNSAIGTRCANNACMLAYLLDIYDASNPANAAIVQSMPTPSLLNLWFASKGCATAYFAKDRCPITGNKLQVLPAVTENAKSKGVMVATLAESESPNDWAAQVNGFVKEATEGKITELVDSESLVDPTSLLVAAEIIKRVFLAGYTFDEGLTEENSTFHNLDGSRGLCHLMLHEKRCQRMPHLKLASGDLVLIPTSVKKGDPQDTAFMAVFLPNAEAGNVNKTDVDAMHAGTAEIADNMQKIVDLVRNPTYWTDVRLILPRVDAKTATPANITGLLADNGYGPLFMPGSIPRALAEERVTTHADGSTETNLVPMPQAVCKAVMMTTFEMHERGFEAAAAVALICYRSCGAGIEPEPTVIMKCDRPFGLHILKLPAPPGMGAESDADLTPPQFLYSMNVTNDSVLKEAKSARERFGDDN